MNFKGIKSKILRFKRIFTEGWSAFVVMHPRYDRDYYQAEINKMLNCGTEANGFATFQCLNCGLGSHKVNFSCKGKACLQCAKRYAKDSMTKIAARLYPGVGYRQVVLTLPAQLCIFFYNHRDQNRLYSLFMALAHACLEELIQRQFKSKAYKIAPIVFLHTNGRSGSYNPHLHVILAQGAFNPQKSEWRAFKALSLNVLRLLWQKHLLGLMSVEFGERNDVVKQLWQDYPEGFYAHPGNNDRVPTKSYKG